MTPNFSREYYLRSIGLFIPVHDPSACHRSRECRELVKLGICTLDILLGLVHGRVELLDLLYLRIDRAADGVDRRVDLVADGVDVSAHGVDILADNAA